MPSPRTTTRTREANPASPTSTTTLASPAREHPALNRQRALGNRVVQRVGLMETLKDVKKHIKGEKDESLDGPSKDAALHARQAFALLESAFKSISEKRMRAGDKAGFEKANELAEHFERGGKLVEQGEKGFEFIVKAYENYELFEEVVEAAKGLREVDLTQEVDRQKAAQAFDRAFVVLGKLGDKAPKGPWSAYFQFLQHFGDGRGFFTSVSAGLDPMQREQGREQLKEAGVVDRPQPQAPAEDRAPVKFDDVVADVDAKIEAAKLPWPNSNWVAVNHRFFKEACAELQRLREEYRKLSWTTRVLNRQQAKDLAEQVKAQAQKAIEMLDIIRRDCEEIGRHVSFENDKAALRSAL